MPITIERAPDGERFVVLMDVGIPYDYFATAEEAEACRVKLVKEDAVTEVIEDAIDDLQLALMADPYNLDSDQADKAIKDAVNF